MVDVMELMKELANEFYFNDNVEIEFSERGIQIIDEISDYAEEREIYKRECAKGEEMFKDSTAKGLFVYLINRVTEAPTPLHQHASIILITPFLRKKLKEENQK